MSTLVAIQNNDQLVGPVLLGIGMLVLAAAALIWDRRLVQRTNPESSYDTIPVLGSVQALEDLDVADVCDFEEPLDPFELPILSHVRCVYRDADGNQCPAVLCFCPSLHPVTGQPMTCTGFETAWCHHSLVSRATTGGHCFRHQKSCPDCRVEDASMFGGVR